jgi:hypothetical protein
MTAAIETVPPIECTPWCTDGTGHPFADEPADQSCHAAERKVELSPTPGHLSGRPGGHVEVHLYRDVYAPDLLSHATGLELPTIEVSSSDTEPFILSTSEARELGRLLVQMADLAETGDRRPTVVRSLDSTARSRRSRSD